MLTILLWSFSAKSWFHRYVYSIIQASSALHFPIRSVVGYQSPSTCLITQSRDNRGRFPLISAISSIPVSSSQMLDMFLITAHNSGAERGRGLAADPRHWRSVEVTAWPLQIKYVSLDVFFKCYIIDSLYCDLGGVKQHNGIYGTLSMNKGR